MNIDKERELFEEWYCEANGTTRDNPYNYLKRDENGEYITQQQRMDFKVWMARAAIAPEWISVDEYLPEIIYRDDSECINPVTKKNIPPLYRSERCLIFQNWSYR